MIVQMTGLQRRQLLTYAHPDLVAGLERGSTQRHPGTKWWQIEMPAIAWKLLIGELRPRLYGPRGGYRHASDHLKVALMRAQTELNRLEHHPALTEGAVMGWHHEAIPVWKIADRAFHPDGPLYTIYPRTATFLILTSHHVTIRGHDITVWAPGEPESGRLTHQESEHLIFCVDQR